MSVAAVFSTETDMTGGIVEFRALGTLEIKGAAGHLLVPDRRKQRLVLAVLLLRANTSVSAETLLDMLWADAAPSSARANLQSYISNLRRLLHTDDPSGPPRMHRVGGGYLLRASPDELDITVFERLAAEGRQALAQQRHAIAAQRLAQALALWRGPVLQGLTLPDAIRPQVERLEQLRLVALEDGIEARIGLEEPAVLAVELTALTASHPLREQLWAHLILALYRCGRQADALEAYQRVYRLLDEELGVQPCRVLQQLHHQVLTADPALTPPAAISATGSQMVVPRRLTAPPKRFASRIGELTALDPDMDLQRLELSILHSDPALDFMVTEAEAQPWWRRAGPMRVPAQLPLDVGGFTGRVEELARLDTLLATAAQVPTAVVVAVVSGTAGVGKTSLTVHWAHLVRDRFPDGQLYVNLCGYDPNRPAMNPAEAIWGFLVAFGVPPQRIPTGLPAQVDLYRSTLAGQKVLVVLDNARDASQVRPLLPGSDGCLVLVTSRNQLSGLLAAEGARPIALDLLPPAQARELLARRLGRHQVASEPEAVDEIIRWCAGLPLALCIAAAHAASRASFRLAALAAELRQAKGLLSPYTDPDPTVDARAAFVSSYRTLSGTAARLFRLLGLHPGPDIGVLAATSLAGIPAELAAAALAELVGAHLIAEPLPDRYTMHDLLRVYALELTGAADSERDRHAAIRRMLDHYLHAAHDAALLLHPHRDPLVLDPPAPDVVFQTLADLLQAQAWFAVEHQVLLRAIDQAADKGFEAHAWQLAWTLRDHLDRQGHWHDWETANIVALAAAERLNDDYGQAHAHHALALAHLRLGRYDTADAHLHRALDLHCRCADGIGQAHTHLNLALVSQRQDRLIDALDHAHQALDLFTAAHHQAGQGNALNTVGWYHAQFGEYRKALIYCQHGLAIQQQIGDRHEQAFTWDSIGFAHHHLGNYGQAADSYQHAIELWRELGDRYYEAETTTRLGDTHHAADNLRAARGSWRHALDILESLGHPDTAQLRARLATTANVTINR